MRYQSVYSRLRNSDADLLSRAQGDVRVAAEELAKAFVIIQAVLYELLWYISRASTGLWATHHNSVLYIKKAGAVEIRWTVSTLCATAMKKFASSLIQFNLVTSPLTVM